MSQLAPTAVTTVGIEMPDDFPVASYEAVYGAVKQAQILGQSFDQYSGAWNAVALRYRAAVDQGLLFTISLNDHGAAPNPEERYKQDQLLYGFFCSGASVFESAFYGLYAIGEMIHPSTFPLTDEKDRRRVSPKFTRDKFTSTFTDDPILSMFDEVLSNDGFKSLYGTRNVLTHRSSPGRIFDNHIGGVSEPTKWKLNDKVLDPSIISEGREILSSMLLRLMSASEVFVKARLS